MKLYNKPNYHKSHKIFEVFYANNSLNILVSFSKNPRKITIDGKQGSVYRCGHKFTEIHKFIIPDCDTITFKINGAKIMTHVNHYPDFKDELIMSTLIKDQDDCVIPWIIFHQHLGVSKFIIYDNSKRGTLGNVLKDYIENGTVILFSWKFKYDKQHAQQLQQTHVIHAFRTSKYIGLMDVDEYVNPQRDFTSILALIEHMLKTHNRKYKGISAISLQNLFFFNPKNKPYKNFKHLKLTDCHLKTNGQRRKKMFVNPNNVFNISVHMITNGRFPDILVHIKLGYFNHYRYLGHKLKDDRSRFLGGKKTTDSSILRHCKFLIDEKKT